MIATMSSTAEPAVVDLRDVTVIKSGKRLIEDVSWRILPGERWVLFGANGSGKTTLMEVVSSYLFPASGAVELFGERLGRADVREIRPRIGYVGAAPTALVRTALPSVEVVLTGLHASFVDTRWHEYTGADWDRARHCLERLHAAHLAERQFGTMSEGEKKRVLIARSLMAEPNLLLLDEPAVGLDLGARERLIDSLKALADEDDPTPVVLVTHHVEEIPPGFDHIFMLAGGRCVGSGPIEQVLTATHLSESFDVPLKLERRNGRWRSWAEMSTE
jgi:iron complex transport system ATP-binding protein